MLSYSVAAPPAGTGLLVDSGRVEVADVWLVPSEEPVAPDPLSSAQPLTGRLSQWEACTAGLCQMAEI